MVDRQNFKTGKSTRCNFCAKLASQKTAKKYNKYAAILPDNMHRERLLNRISACIQRCHNPKSRVYHHYGGRGIFVHEPWREDRREFLRYLLTLEGWDRPYLQLDRIDNNKGYEPDNLRFISPQKNVRNRRKTKDLQDEITDLRYRLRRAEELLRRDDGLWADYCS